MWRVFAGNWPIKAVFGSAAAAACVWRNAYNGKITKYFTGKRNRFFFAHAHKIFLSSTQPFEIS